MTEYLYELEWFKVIFFHFTTSICKDLKDRFTFYQVCS